MHGRNVTVSVDRWKPAYVINEDNNPGEDSDSRNKYRLSGPEDGQNSAGKITQQSPENGSQDTDVKLDSRSI